MRALSAQKHELEEQLRAILSERESKKHEIISIDSELKKINDIDSQKLNVVRRVDKHTYDAIMWLRQHRSEFKGVIYEPPIMTINVKDKGNAKYLESSISFNDMKMFICTDGADHEKFYRKMREEMNLKVNVAVALAHTPDKYQPSQPIDRYKHYGFHSYLKDMIEAPDAVMSHLCHLNHLHQIPVGNSKVNQFMDEIPAKCREIQRYLSDSQSVSIHNMQFL